ncbi:MAG: sulfatase [Thermoanaerobaculales bacterium]|jgi:arylsulfatase A-like enzyme|nr:sulfatase [Thermoanaerobaculales bacterium]
MKEVQSMISRLLGVPVGAGQRATHRGGLVLLCAVLAGCGAGTQPPVKTAVVKVVEANPQEIFDLSRISKESRVADLSPDPDLPGGGWKVVAGGRMTGWKDGFLDVRCSGSEETILARDLAGPIGDIDVVEVAIAGLRPSSSVRLMWAGPDGEFKKKKSLRFGTREGVGSTVRIFRFEVGTHPAWPRDTSSVRLVVAGDRERLRLGRVVGLHRELDRSGLDAAVAETWLFSLGGRHRGMVLAPPGTSVERRFRVPEGGELRFGIGAPSTQPDEVRFRVSVADGGERGETTVVFDEALRGRDADAWSDHVIDLSAHTGRDVRLIFEVEADDDVDLLAGPPMWADPVVWGDTGQEPPPNVVLISVDTLRADHMSLYGYPRPTTPEIDRWADERAIVFETAVAPSPWTLPSHVSMLTGLHAVTHGVNHPAPAPAALLTVAEMLRAKGYITAAVTGGSYLHPRFGLAQGFEDYRSYKGELSEELDTELATALEWIDLHRGRGPFFLFFHTYEVHDPYDPREPFFSEFAGAPLDPVYRDAVTRHEPAERPDRLTGTNRFVLRNAADDGLAELGWDDLTVVTDLYDSGVAYADRQLGVLLRRLAQPDLRDRTLVVLTSDHGEALGEHRLAGHSSLYDHDLLVPLVLSLPGGEHGGRRVAPQVRTVDIVATILDVVGADPPPGLDGRSLLPLVEAAEDAPRVAESYAALSNHGYALRTGDESKYILRNLPWRIPTGHEELYDLRADPGEIHNLADESAELPGLRRAAVEDLDRRLPGLRFVLANRGEEALRIELGGRGVAIGGNTVKTTDPASRCKLAGGDRLRCRIEPGEQVALLVERVLRTDLVIDGAFLREGDTQAQRFEMGFDIAGGDRSRSVVLDPGRGAVVDGDPATGDAAVTVSWAGGLSILGLDPAESDAELRQQLEALGYIQ